MTHHEELPSYRFRDIGEVVREVLSEHAARSGDALLVLVREPSRAQAVEHVSRVRGGRWRALDELGRSALIARLVDAMPVPDRSPGNGPSHSVLTIVMRRGFVVMGREEADWFDAWRYARCRAHVYTSEIVLVTEHGWCDVFSDAGAGSPRLAA